MDNIESSDSGRAGSEVPLHNVSSPDCGPSRRERLEILFKPTYRMRKLRNKGAVMLLIWNFLIMTMFHMFKQNNVSTGTYTLEFIIQLVAVGLTLPIAGWLADVRFGRYKTIQFSMWIMWIAYTLATLSVLLTNIIVSESYSKINIYINYVLMIIASIGLGAFQANTIHFGMDQLYDASTDEITSFIIWYVWACLAGGYITQLAFDCLPEDYEILKMLVVCIFLSAALCSLFLFNNLLVKEPVTQNPFKLVYNVIKYAVKTKHPRCRSAFTYCEDELPSRIDFGMSKYGGPFTTEQVEDVKTFLRFIVLIMIGSVLFGEVSATDSLMLKLMSMLTAPEDQVHLHDSRFLYKCYATNAYSSFLVYFWAIALPVYEFLIYPVFHRVLSAIKSQDIFLFGVLFLKATIVSLMLIETFARYNYLEGSINGTILCVEPSILNTDMDNHWMAFPYVLRSLSIALFAIGSIQFIASQAPYSMRGLISGMAYGLLLLSGTGVTAISVPFTHNLSIWRAGVISCGFWHALTLLTIGGAAGITLYLILKKFKRRKREDVLPNEHIFAERYYDVNHTQ